MCSGQILKLFQALQESLDMTLEASFQLLYAYSTLNNEAVKFGVTTKVRRRECSKTLTRRETTVIYRYVLREGTYRSLIQIPILVKFVIRWKGNIYIPADLTVSKRPGTSYRIKIPFAVFNHLYFYFPV